MQEMLNLYTSYTMLHPEIFAVIAFVLLTTYGVVRRNRMFFNLGYFLYGLSVLLLKSTNTSIFRVFHIFYWRFYF